MSANERKSPAFWRTYAASTSVAVGIVLWLVTRNAWIACVPAAVHLAVAVAVPAYARHTGQAGMAFGRVVGAVVSFVVLLGVFVLIVTPLAVIMRIAGRDPLQRSPKRGGGNWLPAPPYTDLDRMF